jgi:uncharacterized protein YjbI with pentapeptide repeats
MTAPHSAEDSEVPEHRCGFELLPGDVGLEEEYDDLAEWREVARTASCSREAVKDGRCPWHADVAEEVMQEAVAERDERATDLDGAVLRDVELEDGVSFDGCRLRGATFENVTAKGVTFSDANLFKAEFPDAYLEFAEFPNAYLERAEFPGSKLFGAEFLNANLREAEFPDANLLGAEFPDTDLRWAEFPDSDLAEVEFPGAYLTWSKFPDANLERAKFPDADLSKAEFPDADLSKAEFSDADLSKAEFPDADLSKAEFSDADLRSADFPDVNLFAAEFPHADLKWAEFPDAHLSQADLTTADARHVKFTAEDGQNPTNLENAILRETDLRGADLSQARLYQADLTDARINRETTIPDETPYEKDQELNGWFRNTVDAFGAAAWVHRRMERLHEDQAASEEAREFHIRKQEAEREGHKQRFARTFRKWLKKRYFTRVLGNWWNKRPFKGKLRNWLSKQRSPRSLQKLWNKRPFNRTLRNWWNAEKPDDEKYPQDKTPLHHAYRYLTLSLMYHLTRHGESLQLIGVRAAQIILFCGLLYPFAGGVASSSTGEVHEIDAARYFTANSFLDFLGIVWTTGSELLWGIYFSIITFTTIGYGDLYPVGTGSKVLVGAESLSGALLVALFVFVLGRRVAR